VAATLDQILSSTRQSIAGLRPRLAELEGRALRTVPSPGFTAALRGERVALIAEVKRRSPSAGVINPDLDPAQRAALYVEAGAAAISVLTDGPFFGGSMADLEAVVQRVPVPVLRKDFILDEVQIFEARAAGAAAVLLIVRALAPARLCQLLACARGVGLEALVEVHTGAELETAIGAGAGVIGVNSRDLDSFRIDVESAWRLLGAVPPATVAVAESGMAAAGDVQRAAAAGADAVLIGTALSAAPNPGAAVKALTGVRRRAR
jgi:indole-3-glycerol phosphate synthase